jgi:hypothetical protein
MGVRISLHAVDVPKFEEYLDQPLAAILLDYSEHGSNEWPQRFTFPGMIRYESYFKSGIRRLEGQEAPVTLLESDVFEETRLSINAKTYLQNETSFELNFFLRALCQLSSVDWVEEISNGSRRWWIGSFLDYLDKNDDVPSEDYVKIEKMFQKVLRPFNCGKELTEVAYQLSEFEFPVIPNNDVDLWMGVWDKSELNFMVDLIQTIFSGNEPRFKSPPLDIGIAPETDEDWNKLVLTALNQLLTIRDLQYEEPNVISFVG